MGYDDLVVVVIFVVLEFVMYIGWVFVGVDVVIEFLWSCFGLLIRVI